MTNNHPNNHPASSHCQFVQRSGSCWVVVPSKLDARWCQVRSHSHQCSKIIKKTGCKCQLNWRPHSIRQVLNSVDIWFSPKICQTLPNRPEITHPWVPNGKPQRKLLPKLIQGGPVSWRKLHVKWMEEGGMGCRAIVCCCAPTVTQVISIFGAL